MSEAPLLLADDDVARQDAALLEIEGRLDPEVGPRGVALGVEEVEVVDTAHGHAGGRRVGVDVHALAVLAVNAAQIDGEKVRVLAEHTISEEKIDENAVEAALKRAEQQLAEAKNIDPQQYEHLQSMVRYAGVQLALKRRKS